MKGQNQWIPRIVHHKFYMDRSEANPGLG